MPKQHSRLVARLVAALVAPLVAAGLGGAAPASAGEYTVFAMLPVQPEAAGPDRCLTIGLLAMPAGWQAGDAAAVLVSGHGADAMGRDRLVGALLEQATAVFEVGDDERCKGHTPALARAALDAAMHPGGVVAIGFGTAGPNVLANATQGFVAGVAIEDAAVRIAAGAPAAAELRLDRQWPLFCGALASVAPIEAGTCKVALLSPPATALAAKR